jgi:hypothetical protein
MTAIEQLHQAQDRVLSYFIADYCCDDDLEEPEFGWLDQGNIAMVSDGIIYFTDIVYAVEHDTPVATFWEWLYYDRENPNHINLRTWCMGLRPEQMEGVRSQPDELS